MAACFCNRLVLCFDGDKTINGGVGMDKNVCDNTLVFGNCYARSCIEVPSLKAGKAKWKAFL